MLMKVVYCGNADWDYKRALYPMFRDWGMLDLGSTLYLEAV